VGRVFGVVEVACSKHVAPTSKPVLLRVSGFSIRPKSSCSAICNAFWNY